MLRERQLVQRYHQNAAEQRRRTQSSLWGVIPDEGEPASPVLEDSARSHTRAPPQESPAFRTEHGNRGLNRLEMARQARLAQLREERRMLPSWYSLRERVQPERLGDYMVCSTF